MAKAVVDSRIDLTLLRAKETKILETDWKLRTGLQQPKSALGYFNPKS